MPFLLGSDDQATYHIAPQTDTRTIRIGPTDRPLSKVPYLPHEQWNRLLHSRSATLADDSAELQRKADLAKLLRKPQLEHAIEVTTRWGKFNQGRPPAHSQAQPPATISSNEIRASADNGPPAEGPRAEDINTYLHQIHLLQEEVGDKVAHERKLDSWRDTPQAQELEAAKRNQNHTDKSIANLTRQVLQEGIRVFSGRTIQGNSSAPPTKEDSNKIQEYLNNLRDLCGHHAEIEPDIPRDPDLQPVEPTEPEIGPPPRVKVPVPKPTGNIPTDALMAFLAAVSPECNRDGSDGWFDLQQQLTTQILNEEDHNADDNKLKSDFYNLPEEHFECKQNPNDSDSDNEGDTDSDNDSDDELPDQLHPNVYERQWLPIYRNNVQKPKSADPVPPQQATTRTSRETSSKTLRTSHGTVRPPSKPTPEGSTEEIDENEYLTKGFVPLPRIAELNEILYNTPKLRAIQDEERKRITTDPTRMRKNQRHQSHVMYRHW